MVNNDDENNKNENQGLRASEVLKKLITAGMGAAFMTEESIRAYVSELKLPKDVLNYILQGASKSKDELMDRVGNEVVRIISKIDFVSEASKFVEDHKFKITAEVEVIRKDSGGVELNISRKK
ncbi:MAG: hypothetical protein KDD58_15225 [Bdellovibrionales bacterium]|nr:hypothetical protein [Bdellovibrionales bacterium]